MPKVYIIEKSTGRIKCFGFPEDQPNLSPPNYYYIPSNNPPPDRKYTDSDYKDVDGNWVLSEEILSERSQLKNNNIDPRKLQEPLKTIIKKLAIKAGITDFDVFSQEVIDEINGA